MGTRFIVSHGGVVPARRPATTPRRPIMWELRIDRRTTVVCWVPSGQGSAPRSPIGLIICVLGFFRLS